MLNELVEVACPYCNETVELYIDPESRGTMVQDCDVCCRPWLVRVERDEHGDPLVVVDRAQ